jgi:hypothetical protein
LQLDATVSEKRNLDGSIQPWRWIQYVPPKRWHLPTSSHGVTTRSQEFHRHDNHKTYPQIDFKHFPVRLIFNEIKSENTFESFYPDIWSILSIATMHDYLLRRFQQKSLKQDGKYCILRLINLLSWYGNKENCLTSGKSQYNCRICSQKGWAGSSVSVVSGYGLDDRAIEVRFPAEAKDFSSILCGQTRSGAHSASCTMGTGVLSPRVKRGRGLTLSTHPHLVPRSRMSRSYASSAPKRLRGVLWENF